MERRQSRLEEARDIFLKHGGVMRTGEATAAGIHPHTFYEMRDSGVIERLSRGVYRLADIPPLGNPDLVSVAVRVPDGVICLISALAFHDITLQVPHEVHVAVTRNTRPPRIDYPPVRVFRYSDAVFSAGVEIHDLDGMKVKVFSPEKTIADCFRYRNKIGTDVAVEALRFYAERPRRDLAAIAEFARLCRVEAVMRPYLEAVM
ncbi:MAG: type IV toxin-antitoxin system AbiEi family antitoxin domain-containing protein [Candidatus Eisenbacteria bacterium]